MLKALKVPFFISSTKFIKYSKSPAYEWVPFWEHVQKSNLFISPTKLA